MKNHEAGPDDAKPRASAEEGGTRAGRFVFLFYYAAAATVVPILTLYYQQLGISGRLLGILAAIWPAGNVVGAALWGAAADATGRHRLVFITATISAIAAAQLFMIGSTFISLAPVVILFSLAMAPVMPLVDNAVLSALGSQRARYGRVRLWGAVGWGVAAPAAGIAMDAYGIAISFPLYGVLMVLTLVASFALPMEGSRVGANVAAGLRMMATDRRWTGFLAIVVIRGIGGAFVLHFLFIYLMEIGGSGTLRGVALAIATVGELFAFFFAHLIVERLGTRRTILLSLLATAIRLALYGIIGNPYLALGVQLLHGATFSLFLVAGVNYAKEIAPRGMGTTAQSVFTSANLGAGGIIGALLGGVLYEAVGVRPMFLMAAAFLTVAALVFAVLKPTPGAER